MRQSEVVSCLTARRKGEMKAGSLRHGSQVFGPANTSGDYFLNYGKFSKDVSKDGPSHPTGSSVVNLGHSSH